MYFLAPRRHLSLTAFGVVGNITQHLSDLVNLLLDGVLSEEVYEVIYMYRAKLKTVMHEFVPGDYAYCCIRSPYSPGLR